jgi:WD40 repeat protein
MVIAASASHDRTVRIWDVNSQKLLQILKYSDFVWRVFLVLSHGRPFVISFVSALGTIHISDALTGEQKREFSGRLIMAGYIAFYRTPVVITVIGDNGISIIDVDTGQVIRTWYGGFAKVFRAVVSHGNYHN